MDVFIGMIAAFGFNFAPKGWALCNGQLMSVSQNSALFSLLGTQYGGDGIQTFGLPDLRSRVAVGQGQGPGLSNYVIGQASGTENVTLLSTEMPQHTHFMTGSGDSAAQNAPAGGSLATAVRGTNTYAVGADSLAPMASATTPAGGNQPHNNLQPYLAINYCIALEGIYPSRS